MIDVDFEDIHRDDIVNYIKQKYGKVYPVRTFGYLGEKGAIQKAGMALHMEPKVYMSISKGVNGISEIQGYPELVEVANAFNGRLYNFSAHASAVMIFPGSVEDFCSVEKQGDTYVASYDAHVLESYNMLKCDILGLRNLSVIHDTLRLIGKQFDIYRLPHDHDVYQQLAQGFTMGTFQIESKMMQGLCKEIAVDSFDDLANILALGRPGPLDSGLTQQYIDAKKTKEIPELHPIVDEILKSTFGAMIFQEDMLLIAREYAGYSVGEADVLRKTIGRKELDKIDAVVAEFVKRCNEMQRPTDVSIRLGEILKACGRYLFSKNHSYAYATVSNTTAWLAHYYPREYFCSTLNSLIGDHDKTVVYINELKRLKIPLYPPDLSIGNRKWTIEPSGIRVGLEYIKGVGKNLNTTSVDTFESVVFTNTKTCVIPCIKAGALDYLGVSRAVLLAKFATTQDSLKRVQQCQEKIQQYTGDPKKQKLLAQWQEKLREAQEITQVTPEKYDEAAGEYEVLSFSFQELSKVKTGEITNVFTKNDKNGREMAWVTMSTPYGDFRCTVFADGWQKVSKVAVGETYKFVVNDKGILEELQMDGKVIKINERRYKKNF